MLFVLQPLEEEEEEEEENDMVGMNFVPNSSFIIHHNFCICLFRYGDTNTKR